MRRAIWLCSVSLWLPAGCTTDHSALARRPGTGGDASVPAQGGRSGSGGAGIGGGGGTGGSGPTPSLDVVTLVHGVSDAPVIQLCFVRVGEAPAGAPIPAAGLAYGAGLTLTDVPGLDFETDALDVWLFAGELERIAELDCAEALELAEALAVPAGDAGAEAGDLDASDLDASDLDASDLDAGVDAAAPLPPVPPLRAAPLLRIPAGTFFGGRRSLLVAAGCFAGRGGPDVSAVCGVDYVPDRPALRPVIVALSRMLDFERVGLQAVHASAESINVDVLLATADGQSRSITTNLPPGVVAPANPAFVAPSRELEAAGAAVELRAPGTGAGLSTIPLADVGSLGGLAAWENGRGYALVLIGPAASLRSTGFWNAPAVTVVPAFLE